MVVFRLFEKNSYFSVGGKRPDKGIICVVLSFHFYGRLYIIFRLGNRGRLLSALMGLHTLGHRDLAHPSSSQEIGVATSLKNIYFHSKLLIRTPPRAS